ncbi:hypothetical protein M3Y98_00814500 [Aphelenchoides besseyi]|nr:hypothetical protein M3Y98_00814500 [Aphelenchoides besseyi]
MMNFEFIVQLLQASYTPLIIALNVYFISRFRRLSVVHINFRILFGIITLTLVVYYFIYDIQTASKIDLRADRGPFLFHERQPNFVQFVWSVSGSAFCIEIMTLLLLYKHNKIMLSQRLNQRLSVRYQFKENVALVGTLLVGITLFGLLLALEIAAQFLLIQLMLFDLFDMLFVLYIIIWYPQLCNMVKADLRCQSGMRLTDVAATVYVKPSPELEGQTHFQQLNSSWNGNLSSGRNSQH